MEYANIGEQEAIIKRDDLGRFLPGNPPGPGWKNRNEETQKLAKLREALLEGSEEAITELRRLMREGKSEMVRVSAAKVILTAAKIVPDQVFHESWKMVLRRDEKQGLWQHTQEYGEFLEWRACRQLAVQGVNVDAIEREAGLSTHGEEQN